MHIVVIEDNSTLASAIEKVLKIEGYSTTVFHDGDEAYSWLINHTASYDVMILDVLLPGMNGFALCKSLRTEGDTTPILMLTSKGESDDVIEGLDCGADDYLKKPFVFDELLARIRSLSRRPPLVGGETRQVINDDVVVDVLARQVFREDKVVHLTAKEYMLLQYFLQNPRKLMTQQELYDHVFDFAKVQLSNTIEVHIKNLRKKLRTARHELPIVTIRNAGYRFDL